MSEEEKENISSIDKILKMEGLSGYKTSMTELYTGFDLTHSGHFASIDTFNQGFVFITRPLLNLSDENIKPNANFSVLADSNPKSPWAYIRSALDPLGEHPSLLYNGLPFVPLITNSIIRLPGHPDTHIETYKSPPGLNKSQIILSDDTPFRNTPFTLNLTFHNYQGNILSHLFKFHIDYIAMTRKGYLDPYPTALYLNYLDSNVRIWRITLDIFQNYVYDIVAFKTCLPVSVNSGERLNYDKSSGMIKESPDIEVQFEGTGYEWQTPILIDEFNQSVCFHDENLYNFYYTGKNDYIKVDRRDKKLFSKAVAFPWIINETKEFVWYVPPFEYEKAKKINPNLFSKPGV